jgi:hypothetical protein
MVFLAEKKRTLKIVWGALYFLLLLNLIGTMASGGFLGLFAAVAVALAVLNRRLIAWRKSLAILLAISALTAACTRKTWLPEISGAIDSVLPKVQAAAPAAAGDAPAAGVRTVKNAYFDYIVTDKNTIRMSFAGSIINVTAHDSDDPDDFTVTDGDGNAIAGEAEIIQEPKTGEPAVAYVLSDPRYFGMALIPGAYEVNNVEMNYIVVSITLDVPSRAITYWPFALTKEGVFYRNPQGGLAPLKKIPHYGWEKNPGFGTGRGYIWSRSLPLLKDTVILGHGADTFMMYFPHNDYVGQGITNWYGAIVDKPHNLYLGAAINTGVLSLVCLLAVFGIYIVQSFRLYWREKYAGFIPVAGAGIFFGVCGFLTSALVNDSSVSVMPLFYGLLGTGIAINMMVKSAKDAAGEF